LEQFAPVLALFYSYFCVFLVFVTKSVAIHHHSSW